MIRQQVLVTKLCLHLCHWVISLFLERLIAFEVQSVFTFAAFAFSCQGPFPENFGKIFSALILHRQLSIPFYIADHIAFFILRELLVSQRALAYKVHLNCDVNPDVHRIKVAAILLNVSTIRWSEDVHSCEAKELHNFVEDFKRVE